MSKSLLIGILSLLLWPNLSWGQESFADSSQIEIRQFDEDKRADFLADDDFVYDRRPINKEVSLYTRFMRKIRSWWMSLFAESTPLWVNILVFGSMLLVLVGLLLYIFEVDVRNIFGRSEKQIAMDFEEMPTDIHALDFDKLVQTAVNKGEYRRAVRLLYLESLKTLSKRAWIDWQINKTNHDYQLELSNTSVALPFEDLTLHYEYVWYGDFPVDEDRYQRIEQVFRNFQKRLTQKT
ncbi:MAG: DUF4129 domain-containing protein [Bacteroidia bacterium]